MPTHSHTKFPHLASLILTFTLLTACSRPTGQADFNPTESSLYLTSEGTITSATIETYDPSGPSAVYYTEDSLRSYVTQALEAFNAPAGASADSESSDLPATLTSCTLSDGTATLLITFRDAAAYQEFQAQYPDEESEIQIETLSISTVEEAAADSQFPETFLASKDAKSVSADTVKKKSTLTVARIEGPARIETDAPIQYVSEGVTLTGDQTAKTPSEGVSYIIFK